MLLKFGPGERNEVTGGRREKIPSRRLCFWRDGGVEWAPAMKFWMKVKEESEKAGLKLSIQKTKIMVLSLHGK